jgi:hypothetical protein
MAEDSNTGGAIEVYTPSAERWFFGCLETALTYAMWVRAHGIDVAVCDWTVGGEED